MNAPILRPMLAAKYKPEATAQHLAWDRFGLMQPKIDGMRVLFDEGVARSRSWTAWTNRYLQDFAKDWADTIQGWDCEMIPGLVYDPTIFREAMSGCRAEDGASEFTLYLFDNFDPSWAGLNYIARLIACAKDLGLAPKNLEDVIKLTSADVTWSVHGTGRSTNYHVQVVLCPTKIVKSLEEIDYEEARLISLGWEGAILRRPSQGYKWNRATTNQGQLTKLKRFEDAEAIIVGYEHAYENANELTTSQLGYAKRSSHQENLRPKDYLGSLRVRLCEPGTSSPCTPTIEFSIGVMRGYSQDDRRRLLQDGDKLLGQIVKFSHQGYGGGYDKPRTPVLLGFRNPLDIS